MPSQLTGKGFKWGVQRSRSCSRPQWIITWNHGKCMYIFSQWTECQCMWFVLQFNSLRSRNFSRILWYRRRANKGSGLILEIFAGSCRFSKACKNLGFRVLAVDKNPKRAENFPVASFDLTRPHDFSTVCKFAEAEREDLLLAHFAPSCGTASKARERKVPGIPNPPRPLRSESYPDGLAGLTEQEHQEGSGSECILLSHGRAHFVSHWVGRCGYSRKPTQQPFLAYKFHVDAVWQVPWPFYSSAALHAWRDQGQEVKILVV